MLKIIFTRYRPAVQWFLDGLEISERRTEYKQIDDGETYKLILGDVTTEMHGKYKCVVKNDYGKIEDECALTVQCMLNDKCTFVQNKLNIIPFSFFF